MAMIDHDDAGDYPKAVPHFEFGDFADIAIDDPDVRDAALADEMLFEEIAAIADADQGA